MFKKKEKTQDCQFQKLNFCNLSFARPKLHFKSFFVRCCNVAIYFSFEIVSFQFSLMLRSLILPFFLILEFSNFPGLGYSEHFTFGKVKSNNIIVEERCSSPYFFILWNEKDPNDMQIVFIHSFCS